MYTDFPIEYSQRSNDELLHLATQRHSLTTELQPPWMRNYVGVISPNPTELSIRNLLSGRSGEKEGLDAGKYPASKTNCRGVTFWKPSERWL